MKPEIRHQFCSHSLPAQLQLLFKTLEYTFFYLEYFAFGAAPCVGEFLEWRTRGDPCFRIPFLRIIDIVAFKTDPSGAFDDS